MKTIPMPETIIAGDSVSFDAILPNYSASEGWALYLLLRGYDSADVVSTPLNNAHHIYIAASATATWQVGLHDYFCRLKRGEEAYTIQTGQVVVVPNPELPTQYDSRSTPVQIIDAIDAILLQRATDDQLKIVISGRELMKNSLPDLIALRKYYMQLLAREKSGGGAIAIRFGF
jgi:hypothetical protein